MVKNDFKALDAHIGYNVGNGFFEFGYLNSDKGTKSGTSTSGEVTITTTNFGYEFDGYRLGAGYNYNVGNNIVLKPFINYYDKIKAFLISEIIGIDIKLTNTHSLEKTTQYIPTA